MTASLGGAGGGSGGASGTRSSGLAPRATPFSPLDGLRYGALGAPLAFAALPLYVLLPNHYAAQLGVPLAGLGAVLLGTRALDALIDPALGRWVDQGLGRPRAQVIGGAAAAALLMAAGFVALFFIDGGGHTGQCSLAGLVRGDGDHHLPGLQRAGRAAPGLGRAAGRR